MGMGKYKFKLSDMIPNAWFYKLKDMNSRRKQYTSQNQKKKSTLSTSTPRKSSISQPRNSYYFPTEFRKPDSVNSFRAARKASDHFPDSPRKSSPRRSCRRRSRRKTIYKPSPNKVATNSFSAGCRCHATPDSVWGKSTPTDSPDYTSSPLESSPEDGFHESLFLSESEEDDGFLVPGTFDHQGSSLCSSCNCKVSSSTTDIIIDMEEESFEEKIKEDDGFYSVSELELPPILTKPAKFNAEMTEVNMFRRSSSMLEEMKEHKTISVKIVKEERMKAHREQKTASPIIRRSPSNTTGIRLRSNSPRIASRKVQAYARKSVSSPRNKTLSESFAVVKSSVDPQKDFRDSMMEMIMENNIRSSKELEELLACYLSLNAREYHDLIVKAFEQIWFDMTNLRL
ncbi:hypothetical protein Tsubulata_025757 [Turnera subulata]|uniref:Transcription repressor n=1 Tax=Turnera subulata TaxID=218843 RepID=A0A9Q0JKF8_9ROSI|nr:hypothetical protein Tsubulata_025757 [Turnera subulata]